MPEIVDPEEFLAHFGVKGMKWGKHNAAPTKIETASQNSKRNIRTARIGAYGGSTAGLAAGIVGTKLLAKGLKTVSSTSDGQRIIRGLFGPKANYAVYTAAKIANDPFTLKVAAIGGAQVGAILGVKKARKINAVNNRAQRKAIADARTS